MTRTIEKGILTCSKLDAYDTLTEFKFKIGEGGEILCKYRIVVSASDPIWALPFIEEKESWLNASEDKSPDIEEMVASISNHEKIQMTQ